MQNFIFLLNDLNIEAKKHQFHVAFCKLTPSVATIYIAQCGHTGYTKNVAIADLIAEKNQHHSCPG
jgi:hypothetical protein